MENYEKLNETAYKIGDHCCICKGKYSGFTCTLLSKSEIGLFWDVKLDATGVIVEGICILDLIKLNETVEAENSSYYSVNCIDRESFNESSSNITNALNALNILHKKISDECKNMTYRFDADPLEKSLRKPNEYEGKLYIIQLLRSYHFQYPDIITTKSYYTFKGHIRRGQYEIVNNFIKKYKEFNEFPFKVARYMDTPSILGIATKCTFSTPLEVVNINIDINE